MDHEETSVRCHLGVKFCSQASLSWCMKEVLAASECLFFSCAHEYLFLYSPRGDPFPWPSGQAVYQNALSEGSVVDRRVRVMFIGQEGAGKTSLKKSLLKQQFDPEEKSTEAIVPDVQVTVESCANWDTSEEGR